MGRITLGDLKKVNLATIQRAGPRYTPTIDVDAPNLQFQSLVNTIEALALSDAYRLRLGMLEENLRAAWQKAPAEITKLFNRGVASVELGATLLAKIRDEAPGCSRSTMRRIQQLLKAVRSSLRPYEEQLYSQRIEDTDGTRLREDSSRKRHDLQQFERPIIDVEEFIESSDFTLIQNNRLFLKGSWGTGKTHFLCDVTKSRMQRQLPTLLLLGQSLAPNIDPLSAACQVSGLAKAPGELLRALDQLGRNRACRSLLIIDGINEGDREAWVNHIGAVIKLAGKYDHVGLILSCRTPFENQILNSHSQGAFVEVLHGGFDEIEFEAQREFFRYYQIPTPHIPLLAPEFSRPLFLKILCKSIASLSQHGKYRRISDFAAGHKGMTKLLEDFVVEIGREIETDFGLPGKTCWRILKGKADGATAVGISARMAELGLDYLFRAECLGVMEAVTGLDIGRVKALLTRMSSEGLLIEDGVYHEKQWHYVVRLPYQRFSDHLISRHLLNRYLKSESEDSIRRSFYANRPLGKIFKPDRRGRNYAMPGVASAVMLEFPERVKRTLPADKRELLFYLPRKTHVHGWIEAFIEGLLWRSTDSFCGQTDKIVEHILQTKRSSSQEQMLEALVCLATRTGHPYTAERLYRYLSHLSLIDRDLFWSEYLRSCSSPSVIYRILDWILHDGIGLVDQETAGNIIWLCASMLTATIRALRDRATKCLVLLGEKYPKLLVQVTGCCLDFNDPYLPERMLAATYGVLMRIWAFPPTDFASAAVELAIELHQRVIGSKSTPPIEHYLMRDYAVGIIALTIKIAPRERARLSLEGHSISKKSAIPDGDKIARQDVEKADVAIQMDFDNYTTGRLVEGRRNYDSEHKDYRRVQCQIRWRMLDLGYDPERFKRIDESIQSSSFYRRSDDGTKVDRYGKKYSWIAFFEVAGRRQIDGLLPHRYENRISDADIDPSFPDHALLWKPPVSPLFSSRYTTASAWLGKGPHPDYRHLLAPEKVDGVHGPWVLMDGYLNERAPRDHREIFTFLRGLMISPADIGRLEQLLNEADYPGNHTIPQPGEDHYLFAGEIGWSSRFGIYLRNKDGRAKPQMGMAFERTESYKMKKRYDELTKREKATLRRPSLLTQILGEQPPIILDSNSPAPKFVEVSVYKQIPGVTVELPSFRFGWESYHSEENTGGNPNYPAPALVQHLGLRKRGPAVDLVDEAGRVAMVCREAGDQYDGFRSELLYLRSDLLEKYLTHFNKCLVWINWGERGIHHNTAENLRDNPSVQAVWNSHAHVHKQFLVYDVSDRTQNKSRY